MNLASERQTLVKHHAQSDEAAYGQDIRTDPQHRRIADHADRTLFPRELSAAASRGCLQKMHKNCATRNRATKIRARFAATPRESAS